MMIHNQTYTNNTNLFRAFAAYQYKVGKHQTIGVWPHWMAAHSCLKDDLPHVP